MNGIVINVAYLYTVGIAEEVIDANVTDTAIGDVVFV